MNEMTPERLEKIERLHNAASGGQWQAHYHAGDVNDCVEWVRKALSYQPDSTRIHMVVTGTPDSNGVCPPGTVTICITGNGPLSEANADFVATAYNTVAGLIAALRLAWAENERLADELAQAQALIAKLERTTLVGGGGSQAESAEYQEASECDDYDEEYQNEMHRQNFQEDPAVDSDPDVSERLLTDAERWAMGWVGDGVSDGI